MANPLTSELDYLSGSTLNFSVRRMVDGYLYNHTGGAAGTFTASPSSSDSLAAITERTGDFLGTYPATISDVTLWDDGKYKFTFHDSLSGNAVLGSEVLFVADGAEVIAGTGGTGLDAAGMRAALGMVEANMDDQFAGLNPFKGGTVITSPSPSNTTFTAIGDDLRTEEGSYVNTATPKFVVFKTGDMAGDRFAITGHTYSSPNHTFTVVTMGAVPADGDTFDVV